MNVYCVPSLHLKLNAGFGLEHYILQLKSCKMRMALFRREHAISMYT